jgi:hypothetical protein
MNNYLIAGLLILYSIVVWIIAARNYYALGYDHAIEDVLKITETMKKSINKNSELHED